MSDSLTPAVIEQRIRRFESSGIHRTGWPADDQTTVWLIETLRAAGIRGERERFDFPRVEYRTARLTFADGQIDGVPAYDGGFTRHGGLTGELCEDGASDRFGKIVVASSAVRGDARWTGREAPALFEELRDDGVIGVVVPSGDPEGEVVLRNAERIERPFALPVLQISARDARGLSSALLLEGEATLEIDGERLRSRATNVVATVDGSDAGASPVVVMTPKSGWFTCAAERGGGLAIWLAIAERAAALSPAERPRTLHFVASSGHELHHLGLQAYLGARRGLASGTYAWMHLGASIGARGASARMGASDEALHTLATDALAAAGVEGFTAMPAGESGFGEARNIREAGGRFVTFLGGHRYFHSPQDTFERAGDAESVARWGEAAWAIVRGMLAAQG